MAMLLEIVVSELEVVKLLVNFRKLDHTSVVKGDNSIPPCMQNTMQYAHIEGCVHGS